MADTETTWAQMQAETGWAGVGPDGAMTAEFVWSWLGSLGAALFDAFFVALMCLPSRTCAGLRPREVAAAARAENLWPVMWGSWAERETEDSIYLGCGLMKKRPPRGRRGGKADMLRQPGIWLDLDVQAGKFPSPEHVTWAVSMLVWAGLAPHIIVNSGTGGQHSYIRVAGGLSPAEGERLGRGLRLWLQSAVGAQYALDHVENADRVLRAPGSVRMPKGGEEPALCSLESVQPGAYQAEDLQSLFADLLAEDAERKHQIEVEDEVAREQAGQDLAELLGTDLRRRDWRGLDLLAGAEATFEKVMSWDRILNPHGWTKHGKPDSKGHQEWCRPGGDAHSDRSLVTGWIGSKHDIAKCFSASAATGLKRLYDADLHVTKLRAYAELGHSGDLVAALSAWLEEQTAGGTHE